MKKKILIIGPGMEIGGVERSLIGLLDALDYSKVEVDLFLFQHNGELWEHINSNVHLLEKNKWVEGYFLPFKELIKKKEITICLIKFVSKVVSKIYRKCLRTGESSKELYQRMVSYFISKRKCKYDIALGFIDPHYYLQNCVNAKIKIGWVHTDPQTVWEQLVHGKMPSGMYEKLDYIACVSQSIKKSFDKICPALKGKSIVIENILPQKYVLAQANEFIPLNEMQNDRFKILSIGRFSEQKNFLTAIHCAKRMNEIGLSFRWYFIGYGPQEREMRKAIDEENANEYVRILGKKVNPYPYIKFCDLYVQPSIYEGKAVTVREAQMLGKAVLITNFPSSNCQLQNGVDGHICPLSEDGIVEGIKYMMNNVEYCKKLANNCSLNDYSEIREWEKIISLEK